jgi:hypothetical protein
MGTLLIIKQKKIELFEGKQSLWHLAFIKDYNTNK